MRSSFAGPLSCALYLATTVCGIALGDLGQGALQREARDLHFHLQLSSPQIITGLYANDTAPGRLVVHDANGVASWTWCVDDVQSQNIPADLLSCMQAKSAVPEAKWANGGSSVIAIYNLAALVINHRPGDPLDKKVTFGVCLNWHNMVNTHSLELAPDNKLAIATTSANNDANIKIFDVSTGLQANASPVQELNLINSVHSLVWDQHEELLWAVGSDNPPDGAAPSRSALGAYKYTDGSFQNDTFYSYNISAATKLKSEWADTQYSDWWDGGHDATGVPGRRQLLISTDLELHLFDIPSRKFYTGSAVADMYLRGFKPLGDRIGADGVALPRSDLKALSVDLSGNAVYVQANWQHVVANQINILQNGAMKPVSFAQSVYRSRWFMDTLGWPKASTS